MIEVSIGNKMFRTVLGSFDNGLEVVDFCHELIREGNDASKIYLYFTNTGLLKTYEEITRLSGGS